MEVIRTPILLGIEVELIALANEKLKFPLTKHQIIIYKRSLLSKSLCASSNKGVIKFC